MSIELSKMPKLGFGLMRLPTKDEKIDLDTVCKMADEYMPQGSITLIPHMYITAVIPKSPQGRL